MTCFRNVLQRHRLEMVGREVIFWKRFWDASSVHCKECPDDSIRHHFGSGLTQRWGQPLVIGILWMHKKCIWLQCLAAHLQVGRLPDAYEKLIHDAKSLVWIHSVFGLLCGSSELPRFLVAWNAVYFPAPCQSMLRFTQKKSLILIGLTYSIIGKMLVPFRWYP